MTKRSSAIPSTLIYISVLDVIFILEYLHWREIRDRIPYGPGMLLINDLV